MAFLENIRQKIRLSLVLRLNGHALLRLFSVFLSLNIILILLTGLAAFARIEDAAGRVVTAYREQAIPLDDDGLPVLAPDSILSTVRREIHQDEWPEFSPASGEGRSFLDVINLTGLVRSREADRQLLSPDTDPSVTPESWQSTLVYRLTYPESVPDPSGFVDTVLVFEAPLFAAVLPYALILAVVFVLELLLFLGSIPAGSRSARRVLRPIGEMAQITRNINANRLDTRLNLRGSQNELKDLAQTINDMLERIHDAYRSQIRFVSDASHELRTPIAVIQGYTNLLDRWGKGDPEALRESIDALKTESENMKEMVEKLLFLARGDNNTLTLQKEPVAVDRLLQDMLRETVMIDAHHTYSIKEQAAVSVQADRQLLKQAVRILVDNSMKYTPPGGAIALSCHKDAGNRVRIEVQDTGAGIAPDSIPYIFDRFYRADASRDRKTGGTGLGLSIAKWIVERHDGTIDVLSREGLGTRITIRLPGLSDTSA